MRSVAKKYYPIDACQSKSNAETSTASSFKYICNSNDEIEQVLYDTFDCQGTPNSRMSMTDLGIVNFACNYSASCPYAMMCISGNCGDECNLCLSESDAESLRENYDTQCEPFLLDRCLEDGGSFYRHECEGNVLSVFDQMVALFHIIATMAT